MLKNLLVVLLIIAGCFTLINGIAGGLLGLFLIAAAALILLFSPVKKHYPRHFNSWDDI